MTKHKIATEGMVKTTNSVDVADHRLTWKHEAFVNHYVACGNATEAYRRSYDCERMAPKSIETEALRLLKHPGITLALDHYRRNRVTEATLSFEEHMTKLRELRDTAKERGQLSAAVKAEWLRGKAMGFYSDRIEHVGGNEFDRMSIEELYEFIRSEG
jgi:phage terminase small subunit